ncbi:hypothetical protein [Changchengzhania lutea]|uniref:hypothetical protein n=1 Tax=Changchengzhania lutea TaxID=2049305 RepID=UPI00115C5528|nr:hypothetical protein [Changchengzhania lutea]
MAYKDGDSTIWSKPIKVTDSLSHTPLMSSIAVNSNGVIGVSWFDNRNDATKKCYDMYFSFSDDGGKSFSNDYRITEMSSCPDIEKNAEAVSRWKRGGDYHGLKTDGQNFHVVWPDARDGVFTPYYAKITMAF